MVSHVSEFRQIKANARVLATHESRMIDCTRVICISFMMFTHLKEYEGSSVYGGDLNFIGVLTNDYLGRASVPALSLVSGYLLAIGLKKNRTLSAGGFAQRKAKSILLPMLIWNMIYIGVVIAAYLAVGHSHRIIEIFRDGSTLDVINAFTALTDTPANFSLHFIRDFFVCQMLLFLLLRWGGAARMPLLIAIAAYSTLGQLDPLIAREMIVLFATLGALLALSESSLIALASSRPVQVVSVAMVCALASLGIKGMSSATSDPFTELFMRLAMSLTIIIVAYHLAQFPIAAWFHRLAPIAFLTYLLHLPVTSMLWVFWSKIMGNGNDGLDYAIYYLCSPVVAWLSAISFSSALRRYPNAAGVLGLKG